LVVSPQQFGFILGTLVFALLAIADRFSPSRVFLVSAMLGALFNAGLIWEEQFDHDALHPISNWFLSCRNLPVGMKIAMTTLTKDLVNRWDFSGRLVLGTAFRIY
jgi:nitrate/nitrite transporter NarK